MAERAVIGRVRSYIRVSSDRQADTGVSMAEQRAEAERYFDYKLKPQGYKWDRHYEDPAVSAGKVPFLQRKAGIAINAASTRGDIILLSRLDRGFRSLGDAVTIVKSWADRGIRTIFMDIGGETLDFSSQVGKIALWAFAMAAEITYDNIVENGKRSVRQAREDNRSLGHSPYGFSVSSRGKGKKFLYPDLLQRKIGAWILAQYSDRCDVPTIVKALNDLPEDAVFGLNPRTRKRWTEDAVARWKKGEAKLQRIEAERGANLTNLFLMPNGEVKSFGSFTAEIRRRMMEFMPGADGGDDASGEGILRADGADDLSDDAVDPSHCLLSRGAANDLLPHA